MRVGSIVGLLLIVGLTGCADEGAAPEDEAFSPELDEELEATDTTGVIRGVVVDATITPIAGATVRLQGAGLETTSNAEGAFGFSDLDPGTYFVSVQKFGFESTQTSTEVVAGVQSPKVVRVQLQAIDGLVAFPETRQWEGFIQCSVRFVVNALAACAAVSELGDDFAIRYDDLTQVPTFAQSEMVWDSTQSLGDSLKIQYTDDTSGLDNFVIAQGPSPQIIAATDEVLETKNIIDNGLYIRTFTGDYQDTGLSLTLQQGFTVFTSLYYHYAPPEGWLFIEEGGRPAPPE